MNSVSEGVIYYIPLPKFLCGRLKFRKIRFQNYRGISTLCYKYSPTVKECGDIYLNGTVSRTDGFIKQRHSFKERHLFNRRIFPSL